jgi:hypothetical protein
MKTIISDDETIADTKKTDLLAKANSNHLGLFLAETFLYAMNKTKVQSEDSINSTDAEALADILQDVQKVEAMLSKIPHPDALPVPAQPEEHELVYVKELIAAYNDAEGGTEFTKEELPDHEKYQTDFERRRKDYYAAETIRRATRDAFDNSDRDQFEVLKDETYDGVIDVHSESHPNGYVRLTKVMSQAASLPITKCLLSRLPDWIGGSEKKGVCHILVNDQKISGWVADDD